MCTGMWYTCCLMFPTDTYEGFIALLVLSLGFLVTCVCFFVPSNDSSPRRTPQSKEHIKYNFSPGVFLGLVIALAVAIIGVILRLIYVIVAGTRARRSNPPQDIEMRSIHDRSSSHPQTDTDHNATQHASSWRSWLTWTRWSQAWHRARSGCNRRPPVATQPPAGPANTAQTQSGHKEDETQTMATCDGANCPEGSQKPKHTAHLAPIKPTDITNIHGNDLPIAGTFQGPWSRKGNRASTGTRAYSRGRSSSEGMPIKPSLCHPAPARDDGSAKGARNRSVTWYDGYPYDGPNDAQEKVLGGELGNLPYYLEELQCWKIPSNMEAGSESISRVRTRAMNAKSDPDSPPKMKVKRKVDGKSLSSSEEPTKHATTSPIKDSKPVGVPSHLPSSSSDYGDDDDEDQMEKKAALVAEYSAAREEEEQCRGRSKERRQVQEKYQEDCKRTMMGRSGISGSFNARKVG
ncbi:MAG: hypothetical protein M1831_001253 [Alyxoria varia]|nr:MAG: hypothetical protein M1831_001253 [Alyxoria varia]